jgi:hypothetical protein
VSAESQSESPLGHYIFCGRLIYGNVVAFNISEAGCNRPLDEGQCRGYDTEKNVDLTYDLMQRNSVKTF